MDNVEKEVKELLVNKLRALIEHHEDNLAIVIASAYPEYKADWCLECDIPSLREEHNELIEEVIRKIAESECKTLFYYKDEE